MSFTSFPFDVVIASFIDTTSRRVAPTCSNLTACLSPSANVKLRACLALDRVAAAAAAATAAAATATAFGRVCFCALKTETVACFLVSSCIESETHLKPRSAAHFATDSLRTRPASASRGRERRLTAEKGNGSGKKQKKRKRGNRGRIKRQKNGKTVFLLSQARPPALFFPRLLPLSLHPSPRLSPPLSLSHCIPARFPSSPPAPLFTHILFTVCCAPR